MTCYNGKQTSVPAALEIMSSASPQHDTATGDANGTRVPQGQLLAKPNPDPDPEMQRLVGIVMSLAPRYATLKCALKEYLLTERPLHEIAKEHSYTGSALLYWIRKLGLTHRHRGRRSLSQPNQDHRRVLALVRQYGVSEAARREGISKQRTFQIMCRWAPELKGRRRLRNPTIRPVPKPRQLKNIIISFRISDGDLRLLLDSPLFPNGLKVSGSARARAIVLKNLRPSGGNETGTAKCSSTKPGRVPYEEIVNVYNFQVA
jgi:transposase-like protein